MSIRTWTETFRKKHNTNSQVKKASPVVAPYIGPLHQTMPPSTSIIDAGAHKGPGRDKITAKSHTK